MYTEGASLGHLAREFRTRSTRVRSELEKNGVTVRTISEQLKATPSRQVFVPDIEQYARRYLSGEGLNALALDANVASSTMAKRLRQHGVAIRPRSADAAHAAVRGRKQSPEHLSARALSNQRTLILAGPHEATFARLLNDAGCDFTPQLAIGKHNVDFALEVESVAVEIVAGSGNPRAASGRRQRIEYVLDCGWHLVEVMLTGDDRGLTIGSAQYVVTLAQLTCGQPSGRGHHWMIRGDGEPYAANRRQVNDVA